MSFICIVRIVVYCGDWINNLRNFYFLLFRTTRAQFTSKSISVLYYRCVHQLCTHHNIIFVLFLLSSVPGPNNLHPVAVFNRDRANVYCKRSFVINRARPLRLNRRIFSLQRQEWKADRDVTLDLIP